MASVHLDSRSSYWHGAFTDHRGIRRIRSTREKDRMRALAVVERWQRESDSLRAVPHDGITLTNASEILEKTVTLTQRAKTGRLTISDGQEFINELLKSSGLQLNIRNTEQFLRDFLAGKAKSKAKGTSLRYERIVEDFITFLGPRAKLPLQGITSLDITAFRDHELARGVSNASADMAVKVLHVPFNSAKRQNLIAHNPTEAVDRLGHESATRRAFTLDELRKLLAAADEEWRGMILLGYYCGFRIQDAANLRWGQIDFQDKVIRLRPQKERRDRKAKKTETALLPELREWLWQRRKTDDSAVFPTLFGKKSGGAFGLSLTFRKLMDSAHIVTANVASEGSLRAFYDLGFHALRHPLPPRDPLGGAHPQSPFSGLPRRRPGRPEPALRHEQALRANGGAQNGGVGRGARMDAGDTGRLPLPRQDRRTSRTFSVSHPP